MIFIKLTAANSFIGDFYFFIAILKLIVCSDQIFDPLCAGIPKFLDSGCKGWTLDSGLWTLDAGRWTLDAGPWTLDSGCRTVDVKILKLKTVQSFENNEAISITSFFQATLSNHLKI